MLHNFMFQPKWNYTFEEVINCINNQTGSADEPYTASEVREVLAVLGFMDYVSTHWTNDYNLSFVVLDESDYIPTDLSATLLNKLEMRYADHYAVQTDKDLDVYSSDFLHYAKKFMTKLFNKIDYTYAKYSLLLNEYEAQKSHLLDKLGRTRSGSRSVSEASQHAENSANIFNDTPQNVDVIATLEQNQYATELNKGSVAGSRNTSGNDSYSETEQWDNATIMSRLAEIEKEFAMIWKKWLNEFDDLFIEETNYEEI